MAIICPTTTPKTPAEFDEQMQRILPLSNRIQIDLMDEAFTGVRNSMSLDDVWWPAHITADIHLMYSQPFDYLEQIIMMEPSLLIVHVETMFHHMHFSAELHKAGIKSGLAILPETPVENIEQIMHSFDHLLIFSGNLGHFGGTADLSLLDKVRRIKEHHPEVEIGWDGGVNAENARALVEGGVDVLNTGGYVNTAQDPRAAYKTLVDCLP